MFQNVEIANEVDQEQKRDLGEQLSAKEEVFTVSLEEIGVISCTVTC